MSLPKILVSNDDGIEASGIAWLAEAMAEIGDVVVVAPDREQSGAGHSLTLNRPLRIHQRGENRYAIDGTPTDCVNLALKEIMRDTRPDIIVSGINSGPNLGDDITYSGTVSAALEGTLLGVQSVALSLVATKEQKANYAPAAYFAKKVVRKLLKEPLPLDVLLNINVPNIEAMEIDEYKFTRMGARRYGDAIPERIDPRGRKYYWIGGDEMGFDPVPGSDGYVVRQNIVSITPVRLDLTHERYLEILHNTWIL